MRLIDADALTMMCKRMIDDPWNHNAGPMSWARAYEEFVDDIDMAPTIDAEPVKHGRWEWLGPYRYNGDGYIGTCSVCKQRNRFFVKDRCPHCGANMDLEGEQYA